MVLYRRNGQADGTLLTADSNIALGNDAGTPGSILATLPGPAVATARCGDLLVLKVTLVSGSSGFIELGASMTIP